MVATCTYWRRRLRILSRIRHLRNGPERTDTPPTRRVGQLDKLPKTICCKNDLQGNSATMTKVRKPFWPRPQRSSSSSLRISAPIPDTTPILKIKTLRENLHHVNTGNCGHRPLATSKNGFLQPRGSASNKEARSRNMLTKPSWVLGISIAYIGQLIATRARMTKGR